MSAPRPAVRSTYRLQLSPEFGFAHAVAAVPYLRDLGISHLYLSPIFEATPGSTHGYDVTDPTVIRPELGGAAGFDELAAAATASGLEIILDIVPNHMSASHHNPWWYDVMRFGQASQFATCFDIDWDAHVDGKLVLPVLGSSLDDVIGNGDIVVSGGELAYFDARFPLSPESGGVEADSSAGAALTALTALLERQHYRLMYWRDGLAEINYRRFFDVTGLVGVRVEDPEVFELTHRLILELIRQRKVAGLRVDHVDGLKDPTGYLLRLRADVGEEAYLVVEKILAPDEELPVEWPVDGTTGYEALNHLNGVFVNRDGLEGLAETRTLLTGDTTEFEQLEHRAKVDVAEQLFSPEIDRLASILRALMRSANGKPVTQESCFAAVMAATTSMERYRTYMTMDTGRAVTGAAAEALERARKHVTGDELRALEWVGKALSLDVPDELQAGAAEFTERWQQLTGPVVGKGLEDTAFYRYAALTSLNEVGGDPAGGFVSIEEFHRFNEQRSSSGLHSLNTSSTHDTKRSEDVRARINVISEMADEWADRVAGWSEMNRPLVSMTDRGRSPSVEAELFFYQSLLGVLPLENSSRSNPELSERLQAYMVKAAREAKQETNWLAPDSAYEDGLAKFVTGLVSGTSGQAFRESLAGFAEKIAFHGAINSLGQVLLKIAMPGVPDFYQGCESWDQSLVDPDNRRPVNIGKLGSQLSRLKSQSVADLPGTVSNAWENWRTGEIKQLVTWRGLDLVNSLPALFRQGDYLRLNASGPHGDDVCAFARRHEKDTVIAVVTRLCAQQESVLPATWTGTVLDVEKLGQHSWNDAITGNTVHSVDGKINLSDTFVTLPVALLVARAS